MACELKWDAFGVRCIYSDHCTYADVQGALIAIGTYVRESVMTYALHDFTHVTKFDDGVAVVITVGQTALSNAIESTLHTAILASDEHFLSLLKTFAGQMKHDIVIFKKPEEARVWILNSLV